MKEIDKINLIDRDTIINYGKSICTKINNILEKTSLLVTTDPLEPISENAKKAVESLDEFLNSENKNDNFFNKTLKFIGLKKEENISKDKSYAEYKKELDYILKSVEEQKQKTLLDIDLKKSVIEEINPLLEELSNLIEKGVEKSNEFAEEINTLTNTQDTFSENINNKMILEMFKDHLYQLRQSNILYNDQIQGFYMQINNDEQILRDCNMFLNTTLYILMSQGMMSHDLENQKTTSAFIKEVQNKSIDLTKENNLSLQETLKEINSLRQQNKTEENKKVYSKIWEIGKWN